MNVLLGQKILSKKSAGCRHLPTSPEGRPPQLWEGLLMSLSVQGPGGGGVGIVCEP